LTASGRDRIPPPLKPFNFLPDLLKETEKGYKPRADVKPLHIVQPEGVSFKMNGHELEWQNWKMHIGDYRNSPTDLHNSLKFSQRLLSEKGSQSLRLLTMIMVKFAPYFIVCLFQKWSYHMELPNFLTLGSSLLIRKNLRYMCCL
jgi:hypothetical protein